MEAHGNRTEIQAVGLKSLPHGEAMTGPHRSGPQGNGSGCRMAARSVLLAAPAAVPPTMKACTRRSPERTRTSITSVLLAPARTRPTNSTRSGPARNCAAGTRRPLAQLAAAATRCVSASVVGSQLTDPPWGGSPKASPDRTGEGCASQVRHARTSIFGGVS